MIQFQGNNLNPHVSVDCAIFGFDDEKLNVLLIERQQEGRHVLALPGDLISDQENLDDAAARVLSELTHVENIPLKQFETFGDPDRIKKLSDMEWLGRVRMQPYARVITVGYYALTLMKNINPSPSSFARNVTWHPLYKPVELAFDHNDIVDSALNQLRSKLKSYPVGFELLPKNFTVRQLQKLYESILDKKLDKRNFYKKLSASKILIDTGEKEQQVAHKPAKLYRVNYNRLKKIQQAVQLW
ncbi:MAG: NUDIX hydrolase [Candidatus Cyclobacteriaceae bacterium M2_1C_046]